MDHAELVGLLNEVRSHFTRDDDLPDDLLPRIDAALTQQSRDAESKLAEAGVFAGHRGLRGLADADVFWEKQPYGTRLYYGDGGMDYLHRGVLQKAVEILDAAPQPPARMVGCEGDDGLIRTHPEAETCDVCAPKPDGEEYAAVLAAAPQPPAEALPVAWLSDWKHAANGGVTRDADIAAAWEARGEVTPLYTAPPSAPVGVGVVDELLTNIQRACKRGRNSADLTPENSRLLDSFDHIEDLAQQAIRALAQQPAAKPALVDSTVSADVANEVHGEAYGTDWVYHDDRAQQPAAVGVEGVSPDVQEIIRKDDAAWALAELAEAAGAERDSDDDGTWWALRIEHFKALAQPSAPDSDKAMKWHAWRLTRLRDQLRNGLRPDELKAFEAALAALAQQPAPRAPVEARNAILDALNLVHAEGRAGVESATAEMADRLAALAQQPAACAHSWNDYGTVNRAWCSRCNAVAVIGHEDRPYGVLSVTDDGEYRTDPAQQPAAVGASEREQVIARLREAHDALRETEHYGLGKACGRMADGLAAQQPAAVDEAMVERGAKELRDLHREFGDGAELPEKIASEIAEAVLVAALTAQQGGGTDE